ncbi:MAG TPA: ATP-binding protein [Longimicrobium sp.]
MEIKKIAHGAPRSVTDLAGDVASCFFPDDDVDGWETGEIGAWGYVEFAISELGNNVLQHSRSTGYLAAQYYPSADLVRIGIADLGIGIRDSLKGSPFERTASSDLDAVRVALKPRVSGKEHLETVPGTAVNRGMGLTFLRELSEKARGDFLVLSGNGYYSLSRDGSIAGRCGFQGTFCALAVTREEAGRYSRLLAEAKRQFDVTPEPATYSGLFQ